MANGNYQMKPGSKETDTEGGFNTKQTDTISKLIPKPKKGETRSGYMGRVIGNPGVMEDARRWDGKKWRGKSPTDRLKAMKKKKK